MATPAARAPGGSKAKAQGAAAATPVSTPVPGRDIVSRLEEENTVLRRQLATPIVQPFGPSSAAGTISALDRLSVH
jgi:hypothetical protein